MALNTELFQGRGEVRFTRINPDGTRAPSLHLGNCTSAELQQSVEKAYHYENQTGLDRKDQVMFGQTNCTLPLNLEDWSKRTVALACGAKVTDFPAATVTNELLNFTGPDTNAYLKRMATGITNIIRSGVTPNAESTVPVSSLASKAQAAAAITSAPIFNGGGTVLFFTSTVPHNLKTGYKIRFANPVNGLSDYYVIVNGATTFLVAPLATGPAAGTAAFGTVTDGTVYNFVCLPDYEFVGNNKLKFYGTVSDLIGQAMLVSYDRKACYSAGGLNDLDIQGELTIEGVNKANNKAPFFYRFPHVQIPPAAARAVITSGNEAASYTLEVEVNYDAAIDNYYEMLAV